ncbi:hypothetical protein [Parachryseolinea silvisoli]|uniref:hypothetical protein n=1 Tax=Parachryseolinea silvisoli TaxID=2873601 RepID=UPI00226585A7|nr:hypothetical protein [Parachryseolinea silvisoli]MCD9015209.1 hypothetical protein [Parachryseolinea silvisoli]
MGAQTRTITGTRYVPPDTESEEIRHIKSLLKEERKSFLDSLKSDLPSYLNYKFEVVATEKQLEQIRAALLEFGKAPIPERIFEPAMRDGHYGYNWFFNEVIELIRRILYPARVEHGTGSGQAKDGIDTTDLNALQD